MIIYGTRKFRKLLIQWGGPCHHCNQMTEQALFRQMTWFTLFFIPLFPVHMTRLIVCGGCGSETKISRAQADLVVDGVNAAIAVNQVPMVHPKLPGYIGALPTA